MFINILELELIFSLINFEKFLCWVKKIILNFNFKLIL